MLFPTALGEACWKQILWKTLDVEGLLERALAGCLVSGSAEHGEATHLEGSLIRSQNEMSGVDRLLSTKHPVVGRCVEVTLFLPRAAQLVSHAYSV